MLGCRESVSGQFERKILNPRIKELFAEGGASLQIRALAPSWLVLEGLLAILWL